MGAYSVCQKSPAALGYGVVLTVVLFKSKEGVWPSTWTSPRSSATRAGGGSSLGGGAERRGRLPASIPIILFRDGDLAALWIDARAGATRTQAAIPVLIRRHAPLGLPASLLPWASLQQCDRPPQSCHTMPHAGRCHTSGCHRMPHEPWAATRAATKLQISEPPSPPHVARVNHTRRAMTTTF
jgi:hypothetical protein